MFVVVFEKNIYMAWVLVSELNKILFKKTDDVVV